MFRQLKYFQSVVKNNSFSLAAEECHISQSAISQQIQSLEQELGFLLLERKNRKFILTPAGENFYKKTLILTEDYKRICDESRKIAYSDDFRLKIGYLRCYSGEEFRRTVEEFAQKYPDIKIETYYGNHEELYKMLRQDQVDLVLNDQRRAFSDEYVNLELVTSDLHIELSALNPISNLSKIEISDLRNIPCILIASEEQKKIEEEYYRNVIGITGEIIFTENIENAKLLVISGKGYMPLEGVNVPQNFGSSSRRLAICRNGRVISRKYCVFWKKHNSGYYIEEFAALLKKHFNKSGK